MSPPIDYHRLTGIITRSMSAGGRRTGLTTHEWDVAGNCHAPRSLSLSSRSPNRPPNGQAATPLHLDLSVRCRRCDACLRQRARMWADSARAEIDQAARTWFGTLTLSPEWHFKMRCAAAALHPGDFEKLSSEDKFRAVDRVIYREISKYWKRIRKLSGSPLRFVLVCEAHQSGDPHYHFLLHQVEADSYIRWKHLDTWPLGHATFKLLEDGPNAARYITKYLAKSALARVRASKRYGNNGLSPSERSERATMTTQKTPSHRPTRATGRFGSTVL